MNSPAHTYRIFPLGDSAITIDFGNSISEAINNEVIARFNNLRNDPLPGQVEAIPAYSSLTIYYDVIAVRKRFPEGSTAFETMKLAIEKRLMQPVQENDIPERLIKVPVCYEEEFALDMRQFTRKQNLSADEVIQIHVAGNYRVYMLGFLPGFAYLGEIDERITLPRKSQPVTVPAGSVGIAGRQTGIYPFASPGGWPIIGRTPLKLFDAHKEEPTLIKAGDSVQFYSITKDEFKSY